MVQIIQSQPTQRQSALEQALGQAVQGFGASYMQGQQTLRQQALADQQMNLKLAEMGIDATAQDLRDFSEGKYKPKTISEAVPAKESVYGDQQLQGPVQPGKNGLFNVVTPAQEAQPAKYGPSNPMLNYTESKKAQIEAERAKALREAEAQNADIAYKKTQTATMAAEAPYKAQKMQAEIAKINSDASLSPIAKRKMIAEAQKAEAEAGKIYAEANGQGAAGAKLAKMSGETQNKIGSIASGIKALKGMNTAIGQGVTPSYFDSNTPVIGMFKSDNDLTRNQRTLDEVIGRLQSGGAIGKDEEARFRSMGPRPGDNPTVSAAKLKDQETFLLNKLTAFGLRPEDLSKLGFDLGDTQSSAPAIAHPEVDQALQWAKENPNDPRAAEIIKRVGG